MFARPLSDSESTTPLALARALAAQGAEVALLHASSPARWRTRSFVAWRPEAASHALDPLDGDEPPVEPREPYADAPRWIGVIPYEALRHQERAAWSRPDERPAPTLAAPAWWRFGAVACFEADEPRVWVVGRDAAVVRERRDEARGALAAARSKSPRPAPAHLALSGAQEPLERHLERVERAVSLIHAGEIYQVNLARRLEVDLSGSVLELYARLARYAPSPFGAALVLPGGVGVASTSPELLCHAGTSSARGVERGRFRWLVTEPIKGTRPRGRDAVDDGRLARELDADPKERAELAMIVDVERNDLGRVCRTGGVRLLSGPAVVTHRTVHHRVATLAGWVRPEATREEVLAAMLPSGSVTGAPKVRAMELIAELEAARRGLYTGGIGFCAHDGSVRLSMAIRTLVVEPGGDRGHYFTGGGIVAGSSPERELEETAWKAEQLVRATRPEAARG